MRRTLVLTLAVVASVMLLGIAGAPGVAAASIVSRAQFVCDFAAVMNLQPVYPATPNFSDVPSTSAYYGCIEAAYQAGWIDGIGGTLFGPSDALTRAQVAKIEVTALGDSTAALSNMNASTAFTDNASIPSWARGYIVEAVQLGLVKGYTDGSFQPNAVITSADEPFFLSQYAAVAGVTVAAKTVTISAAPGAAVVGQVVDLSALVQDATGVVIPGAAVNYTVNSPAATVSGSTFVASQPGAYIVTATAADGVSGTTTVTVTATAESSTLVSWGLVPSGAPPQPENNTETAAMWADANPSLVITATLNGPNGAPRPFLSLAPGEPVILVATWALPDAAAAGGTSQPTWIVNGSSVGLPESYSGRGYIPGVLPTTAVSSKSYDFTPEQAGEYLVQASWDGTFSVPLVLAVGLPQLTPVGAPSDPLSAGVASVPAGQVASDPVDAQALAQGSGTDDIKIPNLHIGVPINGWIPISGTLPASWMNAAWSQTVLIELANGDRQVGYALPISAAGSFSGVVASPFAGTVNLVVRPSTLSLNLQAPSSKANWYTIVSVQTAAVLPPNLQASAAINFNDPNLAPALSVAATLWANAPDPTSGLEAIANWVSELVLYDYPKFQDGAAPPWATASQVYGQGTGVCQDYADLLTALYRGLGIPAQVYEGYASSTWITAWTGSYSANHAWVQAYYGGKTFLVDPTWNGSGGSSNNLVSSAYTTSTIFFAHTHYSEGPGWVP